MLYREFDHGIVYCGDSLEVIDRVGKFDHVLTDPPYGIIAKKWDKKIDNQFFVDLFSKCDNQIIFGNDPFSSYVRIDLMEYYKYDMVWVKNTKTGFLHAKNRPLGQFENIMVFSTKSVNHESLSGSNRMIYNPQGTTEVQKIKKNAQKFGGCYGIRKNTVKNDTYVQEKTGYPSNVLFFDKDNDSKHPTQKPVLLMEYLVRTFSNENETILDPFLGSGTTAIACINTNRRFIGIERDKEYFDMLCKRIELHYENKQPELF